MEYGEESVRVGLSPHGLGVFSLRSFRTCEFVGPIRGTVMDDPGYESDYCMEFGPNRSLEPDAPFRYLNHSCHPNCALVEMEIEREDGTSSLEMWLEVQADIEPHEQMTIDYAWPASAAIPCQCGSADCRKWIVAAEEAHEVAS